MASTIETTFEFEIGEMVFMKGSPHGHGHLPMQFCIVTRFAEQCDGGIQRLYRFSCDEGLHLHSEVALTREEPAYRPTPEALASECCRVANAMLAERNKTKGE